MRQIERKFRELREKSEGAHMAHVYFGDPSEEFSIRAIRTLAENGADIIEFGFPFSDPIADGATFQTACERALKGGVTPVKCIDGIRRLRKEGLSAPIAVTTYSNIPYVMGFERFLNEVKEAGAQAIIIPDLPIEEAEHLMKQVERAGLHLILQVAPTTSEDRLNRILKNASGFIYLIGVEGVTGARKTLDDSTLKLIQRVRRKTDIPIMVGFGISKREHAEAILLAGADGVVVGSAYARIYSENLENPFQKLPEIAKLANEIKCGCANGYKNR